MLYLSSINNFNCIIHMTEVGLDPHTIYAYDTHRNIRWNVIEYQPLKSYEDPQRAITERKVKKGEATYARPATKKGSFIDETTKHLKDLPAPCHYQSKSGFDQTLNKKESNKHKIDFQLRKNSYLQQIQRHAKIFKPPGVGKYHVEAPQQKRSHSKRRQQSQRRFFYQDSEFLSTAVPGSQCYFPHDEIPNIKKERKTYKDWIKKHSDALSRDRKRRLKQPDPGTYVPLSASFNCFDKMKVDSQKHKKKIGIKKPTHGFGSSDSKFTYNRTKKGSTESRPDPTNYNTMIDWKGKGADARKNNWVRCLSAGPTRSVYH